MVAGLDKDFRGEAFGVMPELTKGEFGQSLQLFGKMRLTGQHVQQRLCRW